jgi:hypothetical protein
MKNEPYRLRSMQTGCFSVSSGHVILFTLQLGLADWVRQTNQSWATRSPRDWKETLRMEGDWGGHFWCEFTGSFESSCYWVSQSNSCLGPSSASWFSFPFGSMRQSSFLSTWWLCCLNLNYFRCHLYISILPRVPYHVNFNGYILDIP